MRNKFAGDCLLCGKHVPPGAGYPQKLHHIRFANGKAMWRVRCKDCVGKGNPPRSQSETTETETKESMDMSDTSKALAIFGGSVALANAQQMANAMQQSAANNPRGSADGSEYLNFSGKRGVYELGQQKEDVSSEDVWLVNVQSFEDGWMCWKGGRPLAKRMASIYGQGVPVPDPEEHGPFDSRNGEGWHQAKAFQLRSLDTDRQALFSSNSKSGVSSVAELQKAVSERMVAGMAFWPIIQLRREQFRAQGQTNYKPVFSIYGWLGNAQVEYLGTLTEEDDFDLDKLIKQAEAATANRDFADEPDETSVEVEDEDEDEVEDVEEDDDEEEEEVATTTRRRTAKVQQAEKKPAKAEEGTRKRRAVRPRL